MRQEKILYGVTEERYFIGECARTSYGIAAYADVEDAGTAEIVASVHDVTSDRQLLAALVKRCNCLELSPIHLNDVIEDLLAIGS